MGLSKPQKRKRIKRRIRSKVKGTPITPRISIFRSNKEIYAQVIDDINGITLAAVSSQQVKTDGMSKVDQAKEVGKLLAKKMEGDNFDSYVFDRGGYLYHGRVKALAEGAREGGLNI